MSSSSDFNDFLKEAGDIRQIKQDKISPQKSAEDNINTPYRQKIAASFGRKERNFLTDGEVPSVDPDEVLSFKLDGIQPGVFKKLRQGKYGFDHHLDLHRKTVAESRTEVYELLKHASKKNQRVILITHGKGAQSNPPARLKSYTNHWLKQVDTVLAFHSAQPQHGGVGSVYVLLKKPEKEDQLNPSKYF